MDVDQFAHLPDAPQKPQDARWRALGRLTRNQTRNAPTARPGRSLRREKVFGAGRGRPLDRNARTRIMHLARVLMRRTESRKHYGSITAKAYAILEALLWTFHNAKDGRCFPSYQRLADAAGCSSSTICAAIKALEKAGLLSWDNRIKRVRERCDDLLGPNGWRWRVIRTSNAYKFNDPASEYKNNPGTKTQDSIPLPETAADAKKGLSDEIAASFEQIWNAMQRRADAKLA